MTGPCESGINVYVRDDTARFSLSGQVGSMLSVAAHRTGFSMLRTPMPFASAVLEA